MMSLSHGAPFTPSGGSVCIRLKSRMRRRRAAVAIFGTAVWDGQKRDAREQNGVRGWCASGWWGLLRKTGRLLLGVLARSTGGVGGRERTKKTLPAALLAQLAVIRNR